MYWCCLKKKAKMKSHSTIKTPLYSFSTWFQSHILVILSSHCLYKLWVKSIRIYIVLFPYYCSTLYILSWFLFCLSLATIPKRAFLISLDVWYLYLEELAIGIKSCLHAGGIDQEIVAVIALCPCPQTCVIPVFSAPLPRPAGVFSQLHESM